MDDINDQINKLSRELDTLHEESTKFQVQYDLDMDLSKSILGLV